MNTHDDDEQFENIVNRLSSCEISKCKYFYRIHGSSRSAIDNINGQTNDIVYEDIISTIHNYYVHSYDIGCRMSSKDKKMYLFGYAYHEHKQDHYLDETKDAEEAVIPMPIDSALLNKHDFAASKAATLKKHGFEIYRNDKFNLKIIECLCSRFESFAVGYIFAYDETTDFDWKIRVSPKYSSLKQELTTNSIFTVTVKQFHSEYIKAKIFSDCEYRKRAHGDMEIQHILSLLFYCNYTQLQYEFSKTYRQNGLVSYNYMNKEEKENWKSNNEVDHENYYHWGKYLSIAVNEHGMNLKESKIKTFYHGLSQKLLFDYALVCNQRTCSYIFCPLSTSSSLECAANFAANGLIVEFENTVHERMWGDSKNIPFSTSWLSDYPYEKEYLFLMRNTHSSNGISINNILITNTGKELRGVLEVLKEIKELTKGNCISTRTKDILNKIVEETFKHSEPYIEQMITMARNGISKVEINSLWFPLFKEEEMRIDNVIKIFPNLQKIRFVGFIIKQDDIHIGFRLMDSILHSWNEIMAKIQLENIKLKRIPLNVSYEIFWKYQYALGKIALKIKVLSGGINADIIIEPLTDKSLCSFVSIVMCMTFIAWIVVFISMLLYVYA